MKDKLERQRIIREVIRDKRVRNQEELSNYLGERGLRVAQATLSRDIRELRITKIHDGDGYCYALPQPGMLRTLAGSISATDSIVSAEFSGSLVVVKTQPGHAAMIASLIDGNHIPEVIGTLAGDDTILMVMKEGVARKDVTESLDGLFKGFASKCVNQN
jgi:transcriptional regulator of arginine metabolism